MNTMEENLDVIIARALSDARDDEALSIIAGRPEEVLARLEANAELMQRLEKLAEDPQHAMKFFETLASSQHLDPGEEQDAWAESMRLETSEAEVGRRWRYDLMSGLGDDLRNMKEWFASSGNECEDAHVNWYLADLSARGGGGGENPNILALARHGLTPSSFITAGDCISAYADPLRDDYTLDQEQEVYLWVEGEKKLGTSPFPPSMMIESTARLCQCTISVAERLLVWHVEAAREKPLLFKGVIAVPMDDASGRIGLAWVDDPGFRLGYGERWASDLNIFSISRVDDARLVAGAAIKSVVAGTLEQWRETAKVEEFASTFNWMSATR